MTPRRWLLLVVAGLAVAAPVIARAPAPLPRREGKAPADSLQASYAKLLAAVKEGRSERVLVTVPVGVAWTPPPLPRRGFGIGIHGSSRGSHVTVSGGGKAGPCEITGSREGAVTVTFDFRDPAFRVTVELTFEAGKGP